MPFCRSLFTEKALLTSKRHSLVFYRVEPTIMTELCERKPFVKKNNMRTRTEQEEQFAILATFRFGTLPMSPTTNNDSASFAMGIVDHT